jgi:hypothetical protein
MFNSTINKDGAIPAATDTAKTIDKPMTIAAATVAYPGGYVVKLAGGVRYEARAADVDVDVDGDEIGVTLICRACHIDLLTIEPN